MHVESKVGAILMTLSLPGRLQNKSFAERTTPFSTDQHGMFDACWNVNMRWTRRYYSMSLDECGGNQRAQRVVKRFRLAGRLQAERGHKREDRILRIRWTHQQGRTTLVATLSSMISHQLRRRRDELQEGEYSSKIRTPHQTKRKATETIEGIDLTTRTTFRSIFLSGVGEKATDTDAAEDIPDFPQVLEGGAKDDNIYHDDVGVKLDKRGSPYPVRAMDSGSCTQRDT